MINTDKYFDTPLETHQVQTEDGYILTMKRIAGCPAVIPNQIHTSNENGLDNEGLSPKPVALIVHGLLCSGTDWMLNTPEKTLPHKLYKEGYDSWMVSLRGSRLSRGHISLTPKSHKFWDFSLEEVGRYDLPAVIDYILSATGNTKLYYIGHSLGCTNLFVTMNLKPEYNAKIEMMIAMCPAVYGKHLQKPILKLAGPLGALLGKSKTLYLRTGEIIPKTASGYGKRLCLPFKNPDKAGIWIMKKCGKLSGAFGTDQIEPSLLLDISRQLPGPTSMKTFCHGAQCLFQSGNLQSFDYGRSGNLKKYGTPKPPIYDLNRVTFPVVTFTSESDQLVPAKDVAQVAKELHNLVEHNVVKPQAGKFHHADFMMGRDADTLVYDKIIEHFNKTLNVKSST